MKRIIPKLLLKRSSFGSSSRMVLVNTVNFNKVLEIGDPVSQAKIYEAQAADELIFLDLDARNDNRGPLVDIIRKAAEVIFMPFTIGGGVNTVEDFLFLLSNGADKVSINTAAVLTPNLINSASESFGAQCVVVSIDYRQVEGEQYHVWINGGKTETMLDPVKWAIEVEQRGAGEVLLTSIDRDGMGNGLDLDLTRRISESVNIPIITSGGCGLASHFSDGFNIGKADAVAAGTHFSFRDQSPMQTRSHIKNSGVNIRLHT